MGVTNSGWGGRYPFEKEDCLCLRLTTPLSGFIFPTEIT